MPTVQTNGITIEYDVQGEGQPLLLVMGLGGQLTDWPDGFIELFVEEGFQVIRFDNRDIGLSSQTAWQPPSQAALIRSLVSRRRLKGVGYHVSDMADDAAGLIDALNIDSAHVVGMSMGGMIAQELAINHPVKVRSLCSIMSNPGDRRTGGITGSLMAKLVRQKPATLENAVDESVRLFSLIAGPLFDPDEYRKRAEVSIGRSFNPDGVARQTAAIAGSRNRTKPLGFVSVPTLVIHGLLDPLVKPSGGIATAKAIPGSRLLAFPDMGHDLPAPRWADMCAAIADNCARSSPATRS